MGELRLRFNDDGDCAGVFTDEFAELFKDLSGGDMMINRASRVEPTDDGKWKVDLSPVGGPADGPLFNTRPEALEYEVKELRKYGY